MFDFFIHRGGPGRRWGGPPGPWMFRHGGRGGRRRRGDVRAAILALLAERPMHGYEMIQELEERTGGVWRPSAGSIYPTLQLLEDEGLVVGEEHEGKRRFTLTDAGRQETAKRPPDRPPWAEAAEDAEGQPHQLFASLKQFMPAVVQIGRVGTPDQAQRAQAVVDDARKKLYAILAENGAEADAEAEGEA
jgi:DNA-binding PadR family transcriptional regulator